ncbi:MAG: hypothetical protein Q7S92_00290 [Candidatus Diapherotrites archaeon]|nr:hypothetical protein [Candidatus Diapherotrites archaeon]
MFPFLFAFALGFKHSYDADHLLAVSNFLPRAKSLVSAVKLSLSWALGHMLTAGTITIVLFFFKETFFSFILSYFELLVSFMLIALGLFSLLALYVNRNSHAHKHDHSSVVSHSHPHLHFFDDDSKHAHQHMFWIGIIHGLASNDELLLLLTVTLTLTSLASVLLGTFLFSLGVVLGMIVFSIILTLPLLKIHSEKIQTGITAIAAVLSIGYGVFSLVGFL